MIVRQKEKVSLQASKDVTRVLSSDEGNTLVKACTKFAKDRPCSVVRLSGGAQEVFVTCGRGGDEKVRGRVKDFYKWCRQNGYERVPKLLADLKKAAEEHARNQAKRRIGDVSQPFVNAQMKMSAECSIMIAPRVASLRGKKVSNKELAAKRQAPHFDTLKTGYCFLLLPLTDKCRPTDVFAGEPADDSQIREWLHARGHPTAKTVELSGDLKKCGEFLMGAEELLDNMRPVLGRHAMVCTMDCAHHRTYPTVATVFLRHVPCFPGRKKARCCLLIPP